MDSALDFLLPAIHALIPTCNGFTIFQHNDMNIVELAPKKNFTSVIWNLLELSQTDKQTVAGKIGKDKVNKTNLFNHKKQKKTPQRVCSSFVLGLITI